MNLSLQSESASNLPRRSSVLVWLLWFATGYCALSCLTLPFIGRVWLGELPVLAVIQLPKIAVAGWLRTDVVMEAIALCGYSRGSFSPDYIMARPYALAITYAIPMIVIGFVGLHRTRFAVERRSVMTLTFLIAACVDYVFTLIFADGQLLTIY